MRYIGFLFPLLFLSCTPEHSTGERDARITYSADANADAGETNQDGSTIDGPAADASRDDANGLDAGVISDANQDDAYQNDAGQVADANQPDTTLPDTTSLPDTGTNPDTGVSDAAGTDAWVDPYCQPQGEAQGSVDIFPYYEDRERLAIILPGETEVHVASFIYLAQGENFNICKQTLELCGTGEVNGSGQCTSPGNEQARYANMIVNPKVVYEDDTNTVRENTPEQQGAKMVSNGINVYAPNGAWSVVRVYLDAAEIGTQVNSGDVLQVNLVKASDELVMIGRSTFGLYALPTDRQYIPSEPMVYYRSKPGFSITSSDYATPNLDWNRIINLMMTAAPSGNVGIQGLRFGVQSYDATANNWNRCQNLGQGARWRVVETGNTANILSNTDDWQFDNADGHDCLFNQVVAFAEVNFDADQATGNVEVLAGTGLETTFQLNMDNTAPGDFIRLELLEVRWTDGSTTDIGMELLELPMLHGTVGIVEP